MFTKEQLAQIIKEETAAVLAEQQTNEAIGTGLSALGQHMKGVAKDWQKIYKVGSLEGDIKKQIATLMKQNAATLAALQKLDARAGQLGVPDEQLKVAIQHSQQLSSALGAEAAAVEKVEPLGDAPAGGADAAAGVAPSPKA